MPSLYNFNATIKAAIFFDHQMFPFSFFQRYGHVSVRDINRNCSQASAISDSEKRHEKCDHHHRFTTRACKMFLAHHFPISREKKSEWYYTSLTWLYSYSGYTRKLILIRLKEEKSCTQAPGYFTCVYQMSLRTASWWRNRSEKKNDNNKNSNLIDEC